MSGRPIKRTLRGRHLLRSGHHRMLRARSFTVWAEVTAA